MSSYGKCPACVCEGQRVPQGAAFCTGLVFGRLGAGLTLCEAHDAMVRQFREQVVEQHAGKKPAE